jgi:hypothetical protein
MIWMGKIWLRLLVACAPVRQRNAAIAVSALAAADKKKTPPWGKRGTLAGRVFSEALYEEQRQFLTWINHAPITCVGADNLSQKEPRKRKPRTWGVSGVFGRRRLGIARAGHVGAGVVSST